MLFKTWERWTFCESTFGQLMSSLQAENYKVCTFKLLTELPVCFSIRDRLAQRDATHSTWKELLKVALIHLVEIQTGIRHDLNGKLSILCAFANKMEDERLFAILKSITGQELSNLSKTKLQAFIERLDSDQRNELANQLTLTVEVRPCNVQTKLMTEPTLLAGRYIKFSRHLYQTPWLVGNGVVFVGCIQDYLAKVLKERLRCDGVVFSAGGREDVDVRMLGNGRPFVVQCIGCRECNINQLDIEQMQSAINSSTNDINIVDLREVTKEEFVNLKSCETEKTKTYVALCRAAGPVETEQLSKLISLAPMNIEQKTPVRVLHRRTLATRSRRIERIHAWHGQDLCDFFILITTEAGTYIKEFVHGDFGRTLPNISDFLGIAVDLVELDVQSFFNIFFAFVCLLKAVVDMEILRSLCTVKV
ncbi:hypothetical protein TTRE_0000070701 [Trichuris trichiura]|uniref:tRNA pseudouridine(55) synthase n=1 Tax=Trichuris trichiura TaxID=36087 RepID=A0A077YXE2_TRITR|nr:hypothetical protein TTRE_0000070701 [Trichuris trichiura]